MEYIYAALILHNAEKDVTEQGITSILDAAGVDVDESRVKALVAALDGVDIESAIAQAAVAPVAATAAPAGGRRTLHRQQKQHQQLKKQKKRRRKRKKRQEWQVLEHCSDNPIHARLIAEIIRRTRNLRIRGQRS